MPAIARSLGLEAYGGYVDLVRERPAPGRAPRRLPPPEPSEGPHLAYAFQWFLFAALASVIIGSVLVGLGAVYGWGYCPCTDWHWDVKRRLGETGLPRS